MATGAPGRWASTGTAPLASSFVTGSASAAEAPGLRLMLAYRGLVGPGLLTISGDVGLSVLWNR
jgi:hypothetical protein